FPQRRLHAPHRCPPPRRIGNSGTANPKGTDCTRLLGRSGRRGRCLGAQHHGRTGGIPTRSRDRRGRCLRAADAGRVERSTAHIGGPNDGWAHSHHPTWRRGSPYGLRDRRAALQRPHRARPRRALRPSPGAAAKREGHLPGVGDVISMGPELIAGTAAILAAAITAGPAYITARKSGRTATREGEATREAIAALHARVDVMATDLHLLRSEVAD